MALRSLQAKQLRRRLFVRVFVSLALFSVLFFGGCYLFEERYVSGIAEDIADFNGWFYVDEASYEYYRGMSNYQVIPHVEVVEHSFTDSDRAQLSDDIRAFLQAVWREGYWSAMRTVGFDMWGYSIYDADKAAAMDEAATEDEAIGEDAGEYDISEEIRELGYAAEEKYLDEGYDAEAEIEAREEWENRASETIDMLRNWEESDLMLEVTDSEDIFDMYMRAWSEGYQGAMGGIEPDTQIVDSVSYEYANYIAQNYVASLALDSYSDEVTTYALRDITLYNLARALKVPFFVVLYAIGAIAIVLLVLNRSVKSFDQLAGAVTKMVAGEGGMDDLPDELGLVRAELTMLRERSAADERAARAAEVRKNELVAYLAHDIKTPLTSVLGYLDLLANAQELPPEVQRRYAGTALSKAERLDGLIDEFFEITRYNLQAIPVERTRVDARLFLDQVADEFFPDAEARDIRIEVAAPEGTNLFIDPDKMARALSNIVRNAVAYADAGTVIRIELFSLADQVEMRIANSGREISEAHLQSIFEKFYREDEARASAGGGAGLGLAIAKEIVEAHGGSIDARSAGGVTEFTVMVPR